jgi:hypothetical protein
MQPTIHLEGEAGYLPGPYPAVRSKRIVGCLFNSVGHIITRKSPCITSSKTLQTLLLINLPWQTMIRGKVHFESYFNTYICITKAQNFNISIYFAKNSTSAN